MSEPKRSSKYSFSHWTRSSLLKDIVSLKVLSLTDSTLKPLILKQLFPLRACLLRMALNFAASLALLISAGKYMISRRAAGRTLRSV